MSRASGQDRSAFVDLEVNMKLCLVLLLVTVVLPGYILGLPLTQDETLVVTGDGAHSINEVNIVMLIYLKGFLENCYLTPKRDCHFFQFIYVHFFTRKSELNPDHRNSRACTWTRTSGTATPAPSCPAGT